MRHFVRTYGLLWSVCFGGLSAGVALPAHADDDTSRRLRQSSQQVIEQRAQSALVAEDDRANGEEAIQINGQTLSVGAKVNDMGKAIYLAMNHQQWADVTRLLPKYQALIDHDQALVAFAQAALARAQGDYVAAADGYRRVLQAQPDFLRAQLELGRVLFENHQNQAARAVLQQARLPDDAVGVRENVAGYVDALAVREAWHGSLAFGLVHNSNLSQSTASVTYLPIYDDSGQHIGNWERRMPAALAGQGLAYEATLSKQKNVLGQHGLMVQGLMYGNEYQHQSAYNDRTAIVYGGYQYRSARTKLALAPLFEFNWQGNKALNKAFGAKVEWQYGLTAKALLNVDAERKRLSHHDADYGQNDGWQNSLFLTTTYGLPKGWLLFGGVDWMRKQAAEGVDAYHQKGARLGVAKSFPAGVDAVVFASWRNKQYDATNQVLAVKRADDEQTYTAIVTAPKLAFVGLTPSIMVRHHRVKSNADWLYGYHKNEVSLKLTTAF